MNPLLNSSRDGGRPLTPSNRRQIRKKYLTLKLKRLIENFKKELRRRTQGVSAQQSQQQFAIELKSDQWRHKVRNHLLQHDGSITEEDVFRWFLSHQWITDPYGMPNLQIHRRNQFEQSSAKAQFHSSVLNGLLLVPQSSLEDNNLNAGTNTHASGSTVIPTERESDSPPLPVLSPQYPFPCGSDVNVATNPVISSVVSLGASDNIGVGNIAAGGTNIGKAGSQLRMQARPCVYTSSGRQDMESGTFREPIPLGREENPPALLSRVPSCLSVSECTPPSFQSTSSTNRLMFENDNDFFPPPNNPQLQSTVRRSTSTGEYVTREPGRNLSGFPTTTQPHSSHSGNWASPAACNGNTPRGWENLSFLTGNGASGPPVEPAAQPTQNTNYAAAPSDAPGQGEGPTSDTTPPAGAQHSNGNFGSVIDTLKAALNTATANRDNPRNIVNRANVESYDNYNFLCSFMLSAASTMKLPDKLINPIKRLQKQGNRMIISEIPQIHNQLFSMPNFKPIVTVDLEDDENMPTKFDVVDSEIEASNSDADMTSSSDLDLETSATTATINTNIASTSGASTNPWCLHDADNEDAQYDTDFTTDSYMSVASSMEPESITSLSVASEESMESIDDTGMV